MSVLVGPGASSELSPELWTPILPGVLLKKTDLIGMLGLQEASGSFLSPADAQQSHEAGQLSDPKDEVEQLPPEDAWQLLEEEASR